MTLQDSLKQYLKKDIIVIMADGRGYRGKLTKIGDDVLVLRNVYETTNQEVDERGYMFWRRVLHSKVLISLPHVLRIWPWDIK